MQEKILNDAKTRRQLYIMQDLLQGSKAARS